MSKKIRIGTIIGSIVKPNEEAILKALQKNLEENIELELVINKSCSTNLINEFSTYKGKDPTIFAGGNTYLKRTAEFIDTAKTVNSYLSDRKPHILFHISRPQLYGFIATTFGRLHGIPSVVRIGGEVFKWHLYSKGFSKIGYITGIYPLAFSAFLLADEIVSISANLVKMLEKNRISLEKISIIRQPVDEDLFKKSKNKRYAREKIGLPPNKTIILSVGRMEKLEKIGYFPEIVEKSVKRRKDLLFVLVGKTNHYKKEIEEKCKNYVKIVEEVPHSKMRDFYNSADLLLHLSKTEGGIPNTILEAKACDLPVIGTPSGEMERILPKTFDSPQKFVEFLSRKKWPIQELPMEFENDFIGKKYSDLFYSLLETRKS